MKLELIEPFARAHHGLVTRAEAEQVGVSRPAWYRALNGGQLTPVHARVARVTHYPTTRRQSILAAVLALAGRPDPPSFVAASHRSAAALLGCDRPKRDPIEVTVRGYRDFSLNGVIVHRTDCLQDLRPTHRDRVPCTNELRTLVDLGAVDPDGVPAALDHFAGTCRLTPTVVAALLDRHGRSGRDGVTALRQALANWPLGDGIPDSELEIAMARLLERADLPPACFHARVAGYEVDFLIEGTPVVIECDGWTYHVAKREQWEFDLDRDAKIHAAGYVVMRRSRRQILFEPDETARLIRALIDRPSVPPAA